ncbi:hypothetical protein ES705_19831 [subsurface metagenome]
MKKFSYKRNLQERNLRKIEAELKVDPANDMCFFYPNRRRTEFEHICPKSQYPELIDCRENLIPISREAHYVITFGTVKQLRELPAKRFREYLEKMEKLDRKYYSRFKMRFE